jgi:hypothetical protein
MRVVTFLVLILAVAGAQAAPQAQTKGAAIEQDVSQIRVSPQQELNFDRDIERLAEVERRYKEALPQIVKRNRMLAPMGRIQAQQYKR